MTGTFTVPTPSSPSGVRGSGAASAWVGIDGATCTSAILQTGIDFTVTSGDYSFNGTELSPCPSTAILTTARYITAAWYEYWPLPATDFTTMPIHAGDVIKLTVTATSSSTGIAVVENVTRGQTVSKTVTSPAPGSLLCQTNAEWIVEDYEEGSSLVPFADFGTVEFTEASATTSGGSMGPANATLINILQNSVILTTSSVSDNGVNVSYV